MDDHSAIEQLVRRRQQELFAFLLARCGNREEVKDLLQDVFVQLWRHRATVLAMPENEQGRYLWAAARNRAIDAGRKQAGVLARLTGPLVETEAPANADSTEDDRLILLQRCIDALPVADRELLLLATVGGLDNATLAERLGSNPNTVRSRLSRIRATVRERVSMLHSTRSR